MLLLLLFVVVVVCRSCCSLEFVELAIFGFLCPKENVTFELLQVVSHFYARNMFVFAQGKDLGCQWFSCKADIFCKGGKTDPESDDLKKGSSLRCFCRKVSRSDFVEYDSAAHLALRTQARKYRKVL